jgi:energy-coupling factor transporter ATP-binding protein EcfA2
MGKLLYIVGAPGSGKSTLVASLLEGLRHVQLREPFAHVVYENGWVQLGELRERYAGTDALPYDAAPGVLAWLLRAQHVYPLIVGEGSRLGTDHFFEACRKAGIDATVLHLKAPEGLSRARIAARAVESGSRPPLPVCVHQWRARSERVGARWAHERLDATQAARRAGGACERAGAMLEHRPLICGWCGANAHTLYPVEGLHLAVCADCRYFRKPGGAKNVPPHLRGKIEVKSGGPGERGPEGE